MTYSCSDYTTDIEEALVENELLDTTQAGDEDDIVVWADASVRAIDMAGKSFRVLAAPGQRATIVAALKFWRDKALADGLVPGDYADLATNGDTTAAFDESEVDALVEIINALPTAIPAIVEVDVTEEP